MADEKTVESQRGEPLADGEPRSPVQEMVDEILEGLPEWIREPLVQNFRQILAGMACALLVVALWSGYTSFVERGEQAASAQLGTAIHTSDAGKRIELLKKVISEHGSTDAADHAVLLLAAAQRDAGHLDEAMKSFDRAKKIFSASSALYDSALMGLGYSAEESGMLGEAAASFKKASADALGYESVALLDLARVSAAAGKAEEALAAYEKFMAASPMSQELDFVRFEIMKLSDKSLEEDKS